MNLHRSRLLHRTGSLLVAGSLALTACGTDDAGHDGPVDPEGSTPTEEVVTELTTVRLLTHDSFNISEEVLADFTADTGIAIEVLRGGDAGQMVNQAILTAGNPQADVLFGIDNTLLSRALEADLFLPHTAEGIDAVDPALRLDPDDRVTPVDRGDVCLNYDKAFFAESDLEVPDSLDDLADPAYAGLLVVENPATSSPGLSFLLGTIATYGDGWTDYWTDLLENDVAVTAGWEDAYYGDFSGSAGSVGDRPLVVSYASSPPAEVIFAEEELDEAPTGVITASCVQQVEFVGILAGTDNEVAARQVVDFFLSEELQADIPLQMFVFPARTDVAPPAEFLEHSALPETPIELDLDEVAANRDDWIEEWTRLMGR